ncbi:MAG: signal peptidase I [Pseudobdellovibrio sp.]
MKKIGLQGSWPKAIGTFLLPIVLIFVFRWFVFEPFVIPSESMVPNLLIHDHILVKKFAYGLKPPVGDGWLFKYSNPQRGDVVVFRFPENRDIFFIKRLIGLPGDEIIVQNGQISINGKPWSLEPKPIDNSVSTLVEDSDETVDVFNYYNEHIDESHQHMIRLFANLNHLGPDEKKFIVPEKSYFMMGDNRDQSHDSRFWGFVPEELLVGKAYFIWLSCSETLASAPFICDPLHLRMKRFFKTIK